MGDFAHSRLPGVPECQARRSLNVDAQARWACWVPSPRAVPLDSGLWLLEVPLSGLAELPLTAVGEGEGHRIGHDALCAAHRRIQLQRRHTPPGDPNHGGSRRRGVAVAAAVDSPQRLSGAAESAAESAAAEL